MKILLVTPISRNAFDEIARDRVRGIRLPDDVEVVCESLGEGPASVETLFDEAFSSASLLRWAQERLPAVAADAIVVNCFADPGVDALRELLDVPVIGAGEAAIHAAALLAPRFSIVSVGKESVPHAHRRLASIGMSSRLASVYGVEIPVLDLGKSREYTVDAVCSAANRAVRDDGADAVVLGCTGMADIAAEIGRRLSVPVIEPTGTGVWTAVMMRSLGLVHGRAWMYTRANPYKIK